MAQLGYSATMGYWIAAGGDPAVAPIAAAITYPESGNDPTVVQKGQPYATTGWGLWQITPGNSEPQCGTDQSLLDPAANACAAVAKWKGAGKSFNPWTTYTGGEYRQYLQSGVQPTTESSSGTLSTDSSGTSTDSGIQGFGNTVGNALSNAASSALGSLAGIGLAALGVALFLWAGWLVISNTQVGRSISTNVKRGVALAVAIPK